MNYYPVLGVRRTADAAAIRSAFRALVRQYHPDAGAGSLASRFCEIAEAYDTLSDPARRRRYDASLRPFVKPASIEPLVRDAPEPLLSRGPRSHGRVVEIRADEEELLELLRTVGTLLWDLR